MAFETACSCPECLAVQMVFEEAFEEAYEAAYEVAYEVALETESFLA
tara:strand:+ start:235 stop:375 length:141 start_codon:yes stop_codon:yes gene_type:complete